jgi:phage shock protein A
MPDSWLSRIGAVVSSNIETAIEAAERHSSGPLMREALREMDRVLERTRLERGAIDEDRRLRAERRTAIAVEAARLDEDARYALSRDRRDLAAALVAKRVALDSERESLTAADTTADARAAALDAELADLAARRDAMRADLHRASNAPTSPSSAHRAEAIYERARAIRGIGADPSAEALAELDALRRDEAIEAQLAALAQTATAKRTPKR